MINEKGGATESTSTAAKLLEKRRRMYQLKEKFDATKEQERERELDLQEKEAVIMAKDSKFQEGLTNFDQLKKEQDQKKAKLDKKFQEETKQTKLKEEKILELRREIEKLKEKSQTIEREVVRMKKYEDFLERVRESNSDNFTEISDILSRFKALANSYQSLSSHRQHYDDQINTLRRSSDESDKKRKDGLLELNNEIGYLQKEIEKLDGVRNDLQDKFDNSSSGAIQKNMELGRMLTAIENLFERCREEEKRVRHDRGNETEQESSVLQLISIEARGAIHQLEAIKNYLQDFKVITEHPDASRALETAKRGQHYKTSTEGT